MNFITFLFAGLLLAHPVLSFSDPIFTGNKYILTSEVTGNSTYLGCGDDGLCSIIALASAQEHDGWEADLVEGIQWQFFIRDGAWAMDVQDVNSTFGAAKGRKIFANNITTGNSQSQVWNLISQSDGGYELNNVKFGGALDVDSNVTPFVNADIEHNGPLKGQYWTFRSIYPQVTTTIKSTTTATFNAAALSTVTVTSTVCPLTKRTEAGGMPLYKRQTLSGTGTGSALLETTTVVATTIVTLTQTVSASTGVVTSTQIVTACGSAGQSASTSKAAGTGAAMRGVPDGRMVLGALCVGMGIGGMF